MNGADRDHLPDVGKMVGNIRKAAIEIPAHILIAACLAGWLGWAFAGWAVWRWL